MTWNEPEGIDAFTTRERLQRGDAILVCAYEPRRAFEKSRLEGAIEWRQLEEELATRAAAGASPDIVVYCA